MSERNDELARLGRGVVEANRRLAQVLTLLEARPAPPDPHLGALLDLLEALDDARSLGDAPWIDVARARAEEHLRRHGLRPELPAGPLDASRHHAIDARPTDDASLHGQIAQVHARGWVREGGIAVRPARVTVWRAVGTP